MNPPHGFLILLLLVSLFPEQVLSQAASATNQRRYIRIWIKGAEGAPGEIANLANLLNKSNTRYAWRPMPDVFRDFPDAYRETAYSEAIKLLAKGSDSLNQNAALLRTASAYKSLGEGEGLLDSISSFTGKWGSMIKNGASILDVFNGPNAQVDAYQKQILPDRTWKNASSALLMELIKRCPTADTDPACKAVDDYYKARIGVSIWSSLEDLKEKDPNDSDTADRLDRLENHLKRIEGIVLENGKPKDSEPLIEKEEAQRLAEDELGQFAKEIIDRTEEYNEMQKNGQLTLEEYKKSLEEIAEAQNIVSIYAQLFSHLNPRFAQIFEVGANSTLQIGENCLHLSAFDAGISAVTPIAAIGNIANALFSVFSLFGGAQKPDSQIILEQIQIVGSQLKELRQTLIGAFEDLDLKIYNLSKLIETGFSQILRNQEDQMQTLARLTDEVRAIRDHLWALDRTQALYLDALSKRLMANATPLIHLKARLQNDNYQVTEKEYSQVLAVSDSIATEAASDFLSLRPARSTELRSLARELSARPYELKNKGNGDELDAHIFWTADQINYLAQTARDRFGIDIRPSEGEVNPPNSPYFYEHSGLGELELIGDVPIPSLLMEGCEFYAKTIFTWPEHFQSVRTDSLRRLIYFTERTRAMVRKIRSTKLAFSAVEAYHQQIKLAETNYRKFLDAYLVHANLANNGIHKESPDIDMDQDSHVPWRPEDLKVTFVTDTGDRTFDVDEHIFSRMGFKARNLQLYGAGRIVALGSTQGQKLQLPNYLGALYRDIDNKEAIHDPSQLSDLFVDQHPAGVVSIANRPYFVTKGRLELKLDFYFIPNNMRAGSPAEIRANAILIYTLVNKSEEFPLVYRDVPPGSVEGPNDPALNGPFNNPKFRGFLSYHDYLQSIDDVWNKGQWPLRKWFANAQSHEEGLPLCRMIGRESRDPAVNRKLDVISDAIDVAVGNQHKLRRLAVKMAISGNEAEFKDATLAEKAKILRDTLTELDGLRAYIRALAIAAYSQKLDEFSAWGYLFGFRRLTDTDVVLQSIREQGVNEPFTQFQRGHDSADQLEAVFRSGQSSRRPLIELPSEFTMPDLDRLSLGLKGLLKMRESIN